MILALTETHIPVSVNALWSVLNARAKRERIDIYRSELIYLLLKQHRKGEIETPLAFANRLYKPQTKPKSAKKIKEELLEKLG